MLAVIKTIFILIFELFVYCVLGTTVSQFIVRRKEQGLPQRLIIGFLVLQVLFQICAMPFIYFDTSLTLLARVWKVLLVIVLITSLFLVRKKIGQDVRHVLNYTKENKIAFVIMLAVILAVCYFVSINGEQNDDAVYYIGLINTTLAMDSMYRFNVYNGMGMDSLYLRRALVTFDIHTAVLCKISAVHPLIMARIGRASENVILTAAAIYLLGTKLFKRDAQSCGKKAGMLVVITYAMNFLFVGNIYTNARFLLTRAYEGKAFSANVLVLFTIYVCTEIITEKTKSNYVILLLILWASVAIASSAIAVNSVTALVLLVPYYVVKIIGRIKVRKNDKC